MSIILAQGMRRLHQAARHPGEAPTWEPIEAGRNSNVLECLGIAEVLSGRDLFATPCIDSGKILPNEGCVDGVFLQRKKFDRGQEV